MLKPKCCFGLVIVCAIAGPAVNSSAATPSPTRAVRVNILILLLRGTNGVTIARAVDYGRHGEHGAEVEFRPGLWAVQVSSGGHYRWTGAPADGMPPSGIRPFKVAVCS